MALTFNDRMVDHHGGPFRVRDPPPGITVAVDLVERASEPLPIVDGSGVLELVNAGRELGLGVEHEGWNTGAPKNSL